MDKTSLIYLLVVGLTATSCARSAAPRQNPPPVELRFIEAVIDLAQRLRVGGVTDTQVQAVIDSGDDAAACALLGLSWERCQSMAAEVVGMAGRVQAEPAGMWDWIREMRCTPRATECMVALALEAYILPPHPVSLLLVTMQGRMCLCYNCRGGFFDRLCFHDGSA